MSNKKERDKASHRYNENVEEIICSNDHDFYDKLSATIKAFRGVKVKDYINLETGKKIEK